MTTSGSVDFNVTRTEICTMALRKVGAIPRGEQPKPEDLADAAQILNVIVKELQTDGVRLWTIDEIQYPLNQASSEFIGDDAKNYRCIRNVVTGAANKPITGADWNSYFYQDGTAGVVWANGVSATCTSEIPLDSQTQFIERAWLRYSNQVDIPMTIISHKQYADIPNKWIKGIPLHVFFDKRQNSRLVLWPIPTELTYVLHLHRVRYLQDLDNVNDNPDIWLPWMNALIYKLASELADDEGLPLEERNRLSAIAEDKLKRAKHGDRQINQVNSISPAYAPERRR